MIDMNFLVQLRQVAGLEFIDFQNDDFYVTLSNCLKTHIKYESGRPILQKTCIDEVKQIMKDYTGFKNINPVFTPGGNLYVDTGYFSPGNVLNMAGLDSWMDSSETTLYRWFTQNKSKIFKASIDYSTGKVSGSFCDLPVELGINPDIHAFLDPGEIMKWGVPVEGLLAGCLVHELGHVFGGCMGMLTSFTDNVVAQAGVEGYRKAKRIEDRIVILKDASTLLGMPEPKKDELLAFAKQENGESFLLFYTNMKVQRNNQRALSVGVPAMTSEVVADMYSIRMGCSKGVLAAVAILSNRGVIKTIADTLLTGLLVGMMSMYLGILVTSLAGPSMVMLIAVLSGFALGSILGYFYPSYSGVYNSDIRRVEDGMRQLIAKLKELKNISPAVRSSLVDDISKLLKFISDNKKWWDDTVIYRAMGWVFAGGDFKAREIEHYTQALNNNELVVLSEKLKGIQS